MAGTQVDTMAVVMEAVDVRGIRRRFGEEDMRIVRVFV
jgi:hypothetical protein